MTEEVVYNGKSFDVDSEGFLLDRERWDEDFARGLAPRVQIPGPLTPRHWQVLSFIRRTFSEHHRCPLVYETCRANGLNLAGLKELFPTGYLRGACKLAGLTYRDGDLERTFLDEGAVGEAAGAQEKIYRVDVHGFLVDAEEWDEGFAVHRAKELKMPDGLTERHWQVLRYLREAFRARVTVPTIYDTSAALGVELDEMEHLFPDGYHRGAVKLAGLRVRARTE